jgi:hypothetical protein
MAGYRLYIYSYYCICKYYVNSAALLSGRLSHVFRLSGTHWPETVARSHAYRRCANYTSTVALGTDLRRLTFSDTGIELRARQSTSDITRARRGRHGKARCWSKPKHKKRFRLWRARLIQRGRRHRCNWVRMHRLADRWLPQPRVLHPWPTESFAATHEIGAVCANQRTYGSVRGYRATDIPTATATHLSCW